jgi:lysophospholipase L1-like esterase
MPSYITGTRILAFGDSLTFDTVSPNEGAFRYYLTPQLETLFRTKFSWWGDQVANAADDRAGRRMCGASGQRVGQIISTYDPLGQLQRARPNIVTIKLGTNDMTQLQSGAWGVGSVAISIADMGSLLDIINGFDPTIEIILCNLIPNTTAAVDTLIDQWNAALLVMVAAKSYVSRIHVVDSNAAIKANPSWAADYYTVDNTHINSGGKLVEANAIYAKFVSDFTVMPRTTAGRRRSVRPHTASLAYSAGTFTNLGSAFELDTAQPWAISFDVDLSRTPRTTNNGLLCLKTDQSTAFWFLLLGTNKRFLEFGSNSNFDRFFPSSATDVIGLYGKGWHQWTIVFDGVARTLDTSYKLYIDGESIPLTNGSGLGASTDQNAIGASVSAGVAGTFDMANLTIWNGGTTMTAAQVADFYFDHKFPSGPTLVRDFPHTDGSGGTLTDSTGTVNGGIGTATWSTSVPTKARTEISTPRTEATARTVAS